MHLQGVKAALHFPMTRETRHTLASLLPLVRAAEGGRCRAADALVPDVIDVER